MLFVTRIAFGVSFGLLALGAMAVVAVAVQRGRRCALLVPRKSPKQAMRENIHAFAAFEHQNRIKRPPFLSHSGGSF
jgi:hypothetical protein